MKPPTKHLIYTIAFDAPNSESYRFLGKMLASSLLRTFFNGDILVFRNSQAPLFLVERKGLEEVYLETPPLHGQTGAEEAWCWKYRVAELIENPEQYDKILFLDCDCLALRNLDELLEGDWDIRYQTERAKPIIGKSFHGFFTVEEMAALNQALGIGKGTDTAETRSSHLLEGANSGTMAIRGAVFRQVMEAWRDIDEGAMANEAAGFRDQASWNAMLMRKTTKGEMTFPEQEESAELSTAKRWHAEPFPEGEVQFPGYLDPQFTSYRKAAITHNIMPDTIQKIEFTFGLYMRTFFCDPTGLFFSMLEM